ncbi:MAG: TetR/AcrR family transcriptional regulator, partial [Firmicutes bacterium]|nr:TetR/AcrR family transcriptional regulator [Bacillota bacterium]
MRKSGRPYKSDVIYDNKQKIIDTTIELIKLHDANYLTVRNVCQAAEVTTGTFYHYFKNKDDLLMYFIKDISFESCELKTPVTEIACRICELYMKLIERYMELGKEFMRNFYTTDNKALSAYMGVSKGKFAAGTIMECCENELITAQEREIVSKKADAHILS